MLAGGSWSIGWSMSGDGDYYRDISLRQEAFGYKPILSLNCPRSRMSEDI